MDHTDCSSQHDQRHVGTSSGTPTPYRAGLTRRSFLRRSTAAVGGMAALVAALSPLKDLDVEDMFSVERFLQKHYKELSPEELEKVLERIRAQVERDYKFRPELKDIKATEGVQFVYGLNLSRCIGCRRCVHACVKENNQSRSPEIQYIRVLEIPRGTIDIEHSNHYYDRKEVPDPDSFYMPVQCHQCKKPPCVKVCPIEATWQEADGITVIDYDWCIGCRYCEAACPYWARRFNFAKPTYAQDDEGNYLLNHTMTYLSNRPRQQGVMEKCHFCLQRTRVGRLPACLEVCPVGARKFGDVTDPESEVSQILRSKRIFVLKKEVGTEPRFFYYFDERHPQTKTSAPTVTIEGLEPGGRTGGGH
ncbi:MAG: 4Fe-4S dicluster domain-containing protein [Planctomycetes bacterium]|nr:4Fe-4S dicluster domain-containing protein [Planctomycetota bacterium]NOG56087.1 4Fe-4S dicluster domain-containing protein [Planctomycetota bacterium]